MSDVWELVGQIPPGGTVVSVIGDDKGRIWAATPAGLFRCADGVWAPAVHGMPFTQINALLSAGQAVFAAGSSAAEPGLVRSRDGGASWAHVWIDQVEAPITCLAASPNFQRDRVILAGTYGDGVLRTTDGGRYWQLSNFGLQDFAVLALAAATEWTQREVTFLATESGVYRSPNGGRAWKLSNAGLEDVVVQALAIHPNGTIFAGTEAGGLYISEDSGTSWRSGGGPDSINSLYIDSLPDGSQALFAAAMNGIFLSNDNGESWQRLELEESAPLTIGKANGTLLVGQQEAGLAESSDGGASWVQSAGFTARRFNWLAATGSDTLFAAGPNDGVWHSTDGGRSWDSVALPEGVILYDFAADAHADSQVVIAASSAGLLRTNGIAADWKCVLPPNENPNISLTVINFSSAFAADGRAWAGNTHGQVWKSADTGMSWTEMASPIDGQAVVAIAPSTEYATDRTLLLAGADLLAGRVQLWRSTDDGESWQVWFDEASDWLAPRIAPAGNQGAKTGFALGTDYLHLGQHDWQRTEITTQAAPVTKLLVLPDSSIRLAVTGTGILVSQRKSGKHWQQFDAGMQGAAPADVLVVRNKSGEELLLGLTVDGKIWRRKIV